MKRIFTVTLELDTDMPVDPLCQRNVPGIDLGEDAIYMYLNGMLEVSHGIRVSRVVEKSDLETPRMLVLSTAHLTMRTADRFGSWPSILPLHFKKGEYGWFIPLYPIEDEDGRRPWEANPDLMAIRIVAESAGCTWVMLDRDGDTVNGLPTYDW